MSDDKTIINSINSLQNTFNPNQRKIGFSELKVSLLEGEGKSVKQFLFSNGFTAGRSRDNDVAIPNPLVSRHHFKVNRENDQWWIYDLNSANRIYINQQLVQQRAILKSSDVISIGATEVLIKIEVVQHNQETLHTNNIGNSSEKVSREPQLELSKDELKARLLARTEADDFGAYTRLVRKIIHEDRNSQVKSYRKKFVWLGIVFFLLIGMIIYQQMTLTNVRTLAIDMFYDI